MTAREAAPDAGGVSELAGLSEAATPGRWEVWTESQQTIQWGQRTGIVADRCTEAEPHMPCDHESSVGRPEFGFAADAAFIVALVNAWRDGLLVPTAEVREVADRLAAFDCTTDDVPSFVDVPDDYESGLHAAAAALRALVARAAGGAGGEERG